jgi:hypothetical protein
VAACSARSARTEIAAALAAVYALTRDGVNQAPGGQPPSGFRAGALRL